MRKLLRKIYNKCIKQFLPMSFRQKLKRADSIEYPIIKNPEEVFEKVYHIKDATWENAKMPDVYNLSSSWEMAQRHDSQDIFLIKDCTVGNRSDIVVTRKGVVWEKANSDVFSKIVPMDGDMVEYDRNHVNVRKTNQLEHAHGECLSLLGVHCEAWSHFIVQYLPKLYYAEKAGLLDRDITIIMPQYNDKQIEALIDRVLNPHKNVTRKIIPTNTGLYRLQCEKLYFIPMASWISNHAEWLSPYDIVIPKQVTDILYKNVFEPLKENAKKSSFIHEKVYLVRRGIRGMSNVDEVEQYFVEQGFYMAEPQKLSLEEKASLFYHAKVIAGPQSSAWSNLLFCNKAKGLMLTPLCRTLDAYAGYLNNYGTIQWLLLTGDDCTSTIHSDYYIPIDKIDAAYKQLINS